MITRSLGSKGIEVHNAGISNNSPSFFSKFSLKQYTYPNPQISESKFIERLINILLK